MSEPRAVTPDVDVLAALFYGSTDELGQFEQVPAEALPPVYRGLLAHDEHMTVTVEQHHGSPVDVRVLDKRLSGSHYARKILLARQTDGRVVQYGLMRINFRFLSDPVRQQIESETTPLGRVLIAHNVLREVELVALWRIIPGEELRDLLGAAPGQELFGRTALIHVNGEPAVELLEIVSPE